MLYGFAWRTLHIKTTGDKTPSALLLKTVTCAAHHAVRQPGVQHAVRQPRAEKPLASPPLLSTSPQCYCTLQYIWLLACSLDPGSNAGQCAPVSTQAWVFLSTRRLPRSTQVKSSALLSCTKISSQCMRSFDIHA